MSVESKYVLKGHDIHQNQVFLNFSWVTDPLKNLIKAVEFLPKVYLCNLHIKILMKFQGNQQIS